MDLQKAFFDYYLFGKLSMPDAVYDELKRTTPVFDTPVPSIATNTLTSVKHTVPMLSLANVFNDEEITEWYNGIHKTLNVV